METIFNISNKELKRIRKYSEKVATTINPLGKEINYARHIIKDLLSYIETLNLRIISLEENLKKQQKKVNSLSNENKKEGKWKTQ